MAARRDYLLKWEEETRQLPLRDLLLSQTTGSSSNNNNNRSSKSKSKSENTDIHSVQQQQQQQEDRLTRAERERLAHSLSFHDIWRITEYSENAETRRKHRWKALVNFYSTTQRAEYKCASIERALWKQDGVIITRDYFVTALISEYKFDASMYYDKQLHNLYLTFDGGKQDRVDWRDILAHFNLLRYFRLVRGSALQLLLLLFDVFTAGDALGRSVLRSEHALSAAAACSCVRRIFLVPCVLEAHIAQMDVLLADLMRELQLHAQQQPMLKRKQLEALLQPQPQQQQQPDQQQQQQQLQQQRQLQRQQPQYEQQQLQQEHDHMQQQQQQQSQRKLLDFWARIAWERLPLELRLTVYDETQLLHKDQAEAILMRHKLQQALAFNHRNCLRPVFREWRLEMLRESGVRKFLLKCLYRKRDRFFRFWDSLSSRRRITRRRRVLAAVMGQYAIKARCFARIQLFNYNSHRLLRLVGPTDKFARQTRLGGTHLREFSRLYRLRCGYHRWWNECVQQHNAEVAEQHHWQRLLRWCLLPWRQLAHTAAVDKRMESIVRENQQRFERMMQDADESAEELIRLEQQRQAAATAAEAAQQQREKEEKLEHAKEIRQRQRAEDALLLLSVQREERQTRIKRQLRRMKKRFKEEWDEKADILLAKAKDRITAYIENRDNKLAIDMKFERVKANFFAPPTPETADRERVLSSVKNICFLFVEAKLRSEMMQLRELIPQFDKQKKGYLSYEEFRELIKATGAGLTNAQMSAVIRGVDADGDGNIDLNELEVSMRETQQMGVEGSPWKMYVDPAEDVICYHNFQTGERIFDYQIKDKKLREIAIADMYGEADAAAVREIHEKKAAEWQLMIREYMARRIQYLYRRRRAYKWRQQKVFKVLNRELKVRTTLQKSCVRFMERQFIGYKAREIFKKQLRLTIEKVWDVDSQRIFWYNHATNSSSWELPLLLRRYGDTTTPSQWVANPLPATEEDKQQQREMHSGKELMKRSNEPLQLQKKQQYVLHYWHVQAQRQLPRKPDGLPLCCCCLRNLAVHRCSSCAVDFCFACHRATHSCPFGFAQKWKLSKKQANDQRVVERVYYFEHHVWTQSKPRRCQLCRNSKICAAVHCNTCGSSSNSNSSSSSNNNSSSNNSSNNNNSSGLDLCRSCSQRVHHSSSKQQHDFYAI